MVVQRDDLGFADTVTVNFTQVLDGFFHAVSRKADVIDRHKFVFVVNQLTVFLLVHRLDRVPVGVEDFGRVLELVEQVPELR